MRVSGVGVAFQVLARLAGAVGTVTHETAQRCIQTGGVVGQPTAEELQELGEFGCVARVAPVRRAGTAGRHRLAARSPLVRENVSQ